MDTPRRAPLFLAAVGGGVVALLLAAAVGRVLPRAEAADGDAVRAHRFDVVDDAGKTRAVLGAQADGSPGLWMYDVAGTSRLMMFVGNDGDSRLSLHDAAGKMRARMAVTADGTVGVAVADVAGTSRAVVAVGSDGTPVLFMTDARGNVTSRVPPAPPP